MHVVASVASPSAVLPGGACGGVVANPAARGGGSGSRVRLFRELHHLKHPLRGLQHHTAVRRTRVRRVAAASKTTDTTGRAWGRPGRRHRIDHQHVMFHPGSPPPPSVVSPAPSSLEKIKMAPESRNGAPREKVVITRDGSDTEGGRGRTTWDADGTCDEGIDGGSRRGAGIVDGRTPVGVMGGSGGPATSEVRESAAVAAAGVAVMLACAAGWAPPSAWAASSEGGRHSRSKLREKEERYEREQSGGGGGGGGNKGDNALVKMDDGQLTVNLKGAKKEVTGLGDRIKRAHKKAVKSLKKKVDSTVSGLNNGGNRPTTFKTRSTSSNVNAGRFSGAGYVGPPPWIGSLVGWGFLFVAAWALAKVFGLGGGSGGGRVPKFLGGLSKRAPPPGAGKGRWVSDRLLGGREVWVEDRYSRPIRGNALADDLTISPTGGLSEKAAIEKRREESKAKAEAAKARDATPPPWWDPPSLGYCPESQREARVTAARAVLARCGAKRVGGAEYTAADLADLRETCQAANASVAEWVRPESARTGIYKAGVEFALDAASLRTMTSMIGPPTKFLTGLAEDIGVKPGKAGRMVNAAVAARVRAELLQAGAQRRQGEDGGAMMTLDGIIGVLSTFPPEANSAELEMVAAGLAPRLNAQERAGLLEMFKSIGGGSMSGPVAEALGVPGSPS